MILLLTVLLVGISALNFIFITTITGKATEGTVNMCLGRLPSISDIPDQAATVNTAFTYQVGATFYGDNSSTKFYDNTSLFAINGSGYISFTPSSGNTGSHHIEITAEDLSSCLAVNATDTFILTISTAAAVPAAGEAAAAAGGGGGGGGGGGSAAGQKAETVPSMKLSEETVKVSLRQSQFLQKTIGIINDGATELNVEVINPLPTLLSLYPIAFRLSPQQSQQVILVFNPDLNAEPGVYSGLVTLKGLTERGYFNKVLSIIIEVESDKVLFDGSIDLASKSLQQGDELKASISIFNLRRSGSTDVTLVYAITNFKNQVVSEQKETVAVDEQASFSKTIPMPKDLPPGQYILSIKILYGDSFATATELFTVEAPTPPLEQLAASFGKSKFVLFSVPTMLVLLVMISISLFFLLKKVKRIKISPLQTIVKRVVVKAKTPSVDLVKMEKKLSVLREGYQRGYISREAYQNSKAKVEELINRNR